LFFTIKKIDILVYSISGCCSSDFPVLSVISVDFDAEVFWRQLLGFYIFCSTKWLHSFSVTLAWWFGSCRFTPFGPLLFA